MSASVALVTGCRHIKANFIFAQLYLGFYVDSVRKVLILLLYVSYWGHGFIAVHSEMDLVLNMAAKWRSSIFSRCQHLQCAFAHRWRTTNQLDCAFSRNGHRMDNRLRRTFYTYRYQTVDGGLAPSKRSSFFRQRLTASQRKYVIMGSTNVAK